MAMSRVCKCCGKPLAGSYISALGADWHPDHFLCAACHLPIREASFTVHDGQPYHPQCYVERVLPRCAYCNAPLVGEYLVDGWGTKFCARHRQEYPACDFCGRLIPPSQQERGDPLAIQSKRCAVCRSRAIESWPSARPLYEEVTNWVKAQLPGFPAATFKLELCDRATLNRYISTIGMSPGGEIHTSGVTRSTQHFINGREVGTEVDGIAVLRGLPTPLFQGVLAHELGHAWLITQGITGLAPWLEEGLCEMLAHRYYSHLSTPEGRYYAQNIEQNPNPIYGEGFRKLRTTINRVGFLNYVTQLRANKHPPA
jgi:hypothetical protein